MGWQHIKSTFRSRNSTLGVWVNVAESPSQSMVIHAAPGFQDPLNPSPRGATQSSPFTATISSPANNGMWFEFVSPSFSETFSIFLHLSENTKVALPHKSVGKSVKLFFPKRAPRHMNPRSRDLSSCFISMDETVEDAAAKKVSGFWWFPVPHRKKKKTIVG